MESGNATLQPALPTSKNNENTYLGTAHLVVHPHERCRYSDSPFARKDTFLYCRVQKWVEGGSRPWVVLVNGLKTDLKKTHSSSFFAGPGPRPGPAKKDEIS